MIQTQSSTSACGCCKTPVVPTPVEVRNRPGLSKIDYRIGMFATFRQAMIEAIAASRVEIARSEFEGVEPEPLRPLRGWTARTSDDYGIALLEMWAYVADILTFYQERIANEAFLRTAVFRDSLLRLSSMLDYQPAAGMAATTHLAFTVDPGKQVRIPVGLLVQSVPGQDEKPQKFETVAELTAEPRWNQFRIYPQPETSNPGAEGNSTVTAVSGVAHLAPDDNLVVWSDSPPGALVIGTHVEDKKLTAVRTSEWRRQLDFAPPIRRDFDPGALWQKWVRKLRLFGHNAPELFLTPNANTNPVTFTTVTYVFTSSAHDNVLELDAVYDDLKEGAQLLVVSTDLARRVTIVAVKQIAAKLSGTAGSIPFLQTTVTQVEYDGPPLPGLDSRHTVIYELQGPEILVWRHKYGDVISRAGGVFHFYVPIAAIEKSGASANSFLETRRTLLLADKAGAAVTATVQATTVEQFADPGAAAETVTTDHLKVTISPGPPRDLDAATAVAFANVVESTHGETIAEEVLGSGDSSAEFQSFVLKKSPVTHVPQPGAPGGAASTLEVRVGGVLWRGVRTLHAEPGDARVYTASQDDEGLTRVQFGDGKTGARLPTGKNNVVATYRQGIGRNGNVAEGRIKTLLDRPVGLTGVTNPDAARGGAEPESAEKVRRNVPNTVRTFGRIVSLRDFEDAAREFAGIAKAKAVVEGTGIQECVRLTVAGDEGAEVLGDALVNLIDDLNARRDPNRPMSVGSYRPVPIQIEVAIWVARDYLADNVRLSAGQALHALLRFENLDLGQPIHLSDVYKAVHDVEGVVAADVNRLQFKREEDRVLHGATDDPVQPRLAIFASELAEIEDVTTDIVVTVETTRP